MNEEVMPLDRSAAEANGGAPRRTLEELLSADRERLSVSESLQLVGELIDLAGDLRRPDAIEQGIAWLDSLETLAVSPIDQMTVSLFRGNAWLELYALASRRGDRDDFDWVQPELERALLAFRMVLANDAFSTWPPVRRAQLFTNIGNIASTLGRVAEAIYYRDEAIRTVPRFGMALGTRAESLDAYRGILYRSEDKRALIAAAAAGFEAATAPDTFFENSGYGSVKARWAARRDELQAWLCENWVDPLREYVVDPQTEERTYRRWCLGERLMLNPLNELGPIEAAAIDSLHLPPIAPHDARAVLLFGILDAMKQEFSSARWSYFEAQNSPARHFSDATLAPHDTGDEPVYGLSVERTKSAYRTAYSVFDKIALFVNIYFGVGLDAAGVTFSKIWREKKVLRPIFAASHNWPLRGLYWIARDLSEPGFQDVTEPDARAMALMRQYLEHRYLRVVSTGRPPVEVVSPELFVVDHAEFGRRTLKLLRLGRAALIMLVSAVYVEERQRSPNRGAWTKLPRL